MDTCKELKIRPPEFLEIGDLLRVNFYRVKDDRINDSLNDSLNLSTIENNILEQIKNNSKINTKQLVDLTKISEPTVNRCLKSLKLKKFIERVGSKKTGCWKVLHP